MCTSSIPGKVRILSKCSTASLVSSKSVVFALLLTTFKKASTSSNDLHIGSITTSAPAAITCSISSTELSFQGFTRTNNSEEVMIGAMFFISSIECLDLTVFSPFCRSSFPKVSKSIQIRSTPAF